MKNIKEEKQIEECGCINYGGSGLMPKYCPEHLSVHTKKKDMKEEILNEFRSEFIKYYQGILPEVSLAEGNPWFENFVSKFIDKVIAARDEEWREKLKELIDLTEKGEDEDYEIRGYYVVGSELEELINSMK